MSKELFFVNVPKNAEFIKEIKLNKARNKLLVYEIQKPMRKNDKNK